MQWDGMSYNNKKKAGETMVIGIIGGGASGMAAALAASENPDNHILLFERQARVGRKLQATGNGRCNLTNLGAAPEHYHGDQADFVRYALDHFNVKATLEWFRSLGLFTVAEPSGKVYPYSDQANSVLDVLRFALEKPNIALHAGVEITRVKKAEGGFCLMAEGETFFCDRLIVACGGLAGSKLGGGMWGYKLLRGLGHGCTRLRPALVQLKSGWKGCISLKGVRANCQVQIYRDGQLYNQSTGELQFTDYGISGPVIFETSRDVCQGGGLWQCHLDFLPDMDAETLCSELLRRRSTHWTTDDLLTGILHNRLGRVLTATAGIRTMPCAELTERQIREVVSLVKCLELDLTDTMGMDNAQVTAGGIFTAEFNETTMESRLVPGLYACGEVLDIDGDCGGYNLQWAWSSGRLAGLAAGGIK